MWWLFCILTTTAYKGILISHLTIPSTSPTLDTLEQLADSSFEWGMLDTYGSGYQLFRASTVPIYKRLFEDMQYANMKVSMEKVLDSGYAFISWKTYFRNLIAKDFTDSNGYTAVHIAREDFFPAGFGWAFPKGSLYLTKFDQLVQRLIESGLIEKWMSDLIRNSALQSRMALRAKKESAKEQEGSPPAATADPENPVPLAFTIYHLQGAFFAIFIGFSLSVLAFLAELCFGNSRKDERPKTTDEGEQESE
ncbi:ionotropic receptor 21a-like [Oratosquilla oratoria]